MKSLIVLTAAAVAAATLTASGQASNNRGVASTKALQQQVHALRQGISWHRSMTWHYQTEAGLARTPTAHAERHTRSVPFLRWIDQTWSHRRVAAKHRLASNRLPWTSDWQTAVRIVQRDWPGSSSWLLACSSSEGGWGYFVMNTQGSGAGGWMQYMSSTFTSQYGSALDHARRYHLALPPSSAASWRSALGQAFAAGWAYKWSGTGPWSGGSC